MNKISLYYHTMIHMKPSQVLYRVLNRLGVSCPLGSKVSDNVKSVEKIFCPAELDFDPVFLTRFSVEELMENKVTLLHSSKEQDWTSTWEHADQSALWNFNLHYFEYLFPLVKKYLESRDQKYLDKTLEIITGWIDGNAVGKHPAWMPYPTALRIINWLCYYSYVGEQLPQAFRRKFLDSLHTQYKYLSNHLEKDILGNHYFEDLKSLLLSALFFKDEPVFLRAIAAFEAECREEILPDGLHFELSPMYHKIIFEGVLRVTVALQKAGRADAELETFLQPMLDAAYSLENGVERIPLFNDGGNNVAKSIDALTETAERYFNLEPRNKVFFPDAGLYIFTKTVSGRKWKLIVDAGLPGPAYIPGHAHCDAMSFELFCDGKPVIVNCGTYAYQCAERSFFRSTAAHNTVMANGVEQSQCWGAFRMAKRSHVRVICVDNYHICMEMTDQRGQRVQRNISLGDSLLIEDCAPACHLTAFFHFTSQPNLDDQFIILDGSTYVKQLQHPYSVDYGSLERVEAIEISGMEYLRVKYNLEC